MTRPRAHVPPTSAGDPVSAVAEAFARAAKAAKLAVAIGVELSAKFAGFLERFRTYLEAAHLPEPHAFTPDYDLRCAAPACGRGPEEHR